MPHTKRPRTLILIGGHEDKEGDRAILKEVARRVGNGPLVITAVASHEPEGYFETYQRVFKELGVREVRELEVRTREDAAQEKKSDCLEGAAGVFFTGGDQLRITSQIGDTLVYRRLMAVYEKGGLIAGTSAGASVVCDTMLVQGHAQESHRIGDVRMAPGLGILKDVIVDQHFAERGRIGRLLGAVTQNPRVLGVGIDEDTSVCIENEERFTVLGNAAVTVVDGSGITTSNIAEDGDDAVLTVTDVKLHILGSGARFDLKARRPLLPED
ncbi:MAG TPA: cyanophycinase [Deinococcales bacterium]|nr:cyanophycinase [Deinococcales bacterium]